MTPPAATPSPTVPPARVPVPASGAQVPVRPVHVTARHPCTRPGHTDPGSALPGPAIPGNAASGHAAAGSADRGSISVLVVFFTLIALALASLLVDVGNALNARERAADIAEQAARAGANDISCRRCAPAAWKSTRPPHVAARRAW